MQKLTRLVLSLLAVAVAIGIFELSLRLLTPEPENLRKLKSSALFLFENKPNAVFPYGGGAEFENLIRINSDGFRDDQFSKEKDSETLRIAVLGDSQEEALQVDLPDTWQKITARILTEKLGKKVESYNFGFSGYGTDQEWLILREKVWQFRPDLVILAFSPNDVGDTYKNQLVELSNGQIRVKTAAERIGGNILGKLARETYTYHLIVKAASLNGLTKQIVEGIRVRILGFAPEERFFLSDAQLVEGPFEVIASQKNPPPEVLKTWKVIEALVFDMARQAQEHNAGFLVTVNIPRAQVDPAGWEEIRVLYELDPAASSPYEINEVMARICRKAGVTYYDLREEAIRWREQYGILHYVRDAHFNRNGHLFMGTKVAEYILDKNLLAD